MSVGGNPDNCRHQTGTRQADGSGEALLLDAVVYPHRSLSQRGFLVLMAAICACSVAVGMAFFLMGAWPVVGFLGLDVLIVYIAFRLNFRSGRAYETLRLTHECLEITKVDPRGQRRRAEMEPTWMAVDMDDPPHRRSKLILRSRGHKLEIGTFLTPSEKLDLARTLRRALEAARDRVFC
jgi:uncharacterized membrane protein